MVTGKSKYGKKMQALFLDLTNFALHRKLVGSQSKSIGSVFEGTEMVDE